MESYKESIKAEWKKVEDFYKSITPKHGSVLCVGMSDRTCHEG